MDLTDNRYTYISSGTTTQIFTGKGILHAIIVGETAAGAITVADAISGSTPAVAVLKASIGEGTYKYKCSISKGLRIVTAAASKITVVWSQA